MFNNGYKLCFCFAIIASIFIFIGYMIASFGDISNARKIEANMENTVYLDLKDGRVVIRMLPNIAPKHVDRIK